MIKHTRVGTLLLSLNAACLASAQLARVAPEPLLERMAAAYASAKSYSDNGVVYTYRDHAHEPAYTTFKTYFIRPDYFRFEMTNNVGSPHFPQDYKVLWSDSRETYSWWQSHPQITTNRDLTAAVNGFTGISSRSVHNIPSLLQKELGWQECLDEITSPIVVGEELFEKTDCYRIRGGGRGQRQFELWLGKSDYLLRKIKTTYPDFRQEEIHREIAIDQEISRDIFHFTPPKPGR